MRKCSKLEGKLQHSRDMMKHRYNIKQQKWALWVLHKVEDFTAKYLMPAYVGVIIIGTITCIISFIIQSF